MLIADNVALIAIMGKPLFVLSVCLRTGRALSAAGVMFAAYKMPIKKKV